MNKTYDVVIVGAGGSGLSARAGGGEGGGTSGKAEERSNAIT